MTKYVECEGCRYIQSRTHKKCMSCGGTRFVDAPENVEPGKAAEPAGSPTPKYDRDEVRRLERELEAEGDNRFRPYHFGDPVGKDGSPSPQPPFKLAESAPKTGEHFLALNFDGIGFGYTNGKKQPWACVVHYWANPGEEGFYPSLGPESKITFTHWSELLAGERVGELEAQLATAQEELRSVLGDWNALVAAIGARKNGTAVGEAKQIVREREELRNALTQANAFIAEVNKGQWSYLEGSEIYDDAKVVMDAIQGALGTGEEGTK